MATIPSPADIQRQTPRDQMRLQEERAPSYEGEKAEIALTGEVGKFGEQAFKVTEYLAGVAAEDAGNQLAMKDLDRNKRMSEKKGADAGGNLLKEQEDERTKDIKSISESMKNSRAAAIFAGKAESSRASQMAGVVRHTMVEQKNYADTTFKTGNEVDQKIMLAGGYNDPVAFDKAVSDTTNRVSAYTIKELGTGLTADQISVLPKGEQAAATKAAAEHKGMIATIVREKTGELILSAVQGSLKNGDTVRAEAIVQANGGRMNSDQYKKALEIIKPNADYQAGMRALDTYEQDVAIGTPPVEANNKIMKALTREQFANYNQLKNIKEADFIKADTDKLGAMMSGFMEEKDKGAPGAKKFSAEIQSTDDFITMSGPARTKFLQLVDNELGPNSAATQTALMMSGMGRYGELSSDDEKLIKMTPGQINAERLVIGNTLTVQLLSQYTALKSGVAKDRIPEKTILDAIPKDMLKNKDAVNAFNGFISNEVAKYKRDNPDTKMTPEVQAGIINSAFKSNVELGKTWGGMGDKTTAAYQQAAGSMPKEVADNTRGSDKDRTDIYAQLKEAEEAGIKNKSITSRYSDADMAYYINEIIDGRKKAKDDANAKARKKTAVSEAPNGINFGGYYEPSSLVKAIPGER